MQQVVAPCPEIIMSIKGKETRSLLDSGSEVTLVNESYYKEHIGIPAGTIIRVV